MHIDTDAIRRDDAAYWAAALVLAIQNRNRANAQTARDQLRRLGYTLTALRRSRRRGTTADDRQGAARG